MASQPLSNIQPSACIAGVTDDDLGARVIDALSAVAFAPLGMVTAENSSEKANTPSRGGVCTMRDKLKALELLGRHRGLFHDKVDVSATAGVADHLARARARLLTSASLSASGVASAPRSLSTKALS